jgi:hypothetical protein
MQSHSTDLPCPSTAGNTMAAPRRHILLAVSVTLTVVLGPLITVVYRLIRSPDAVIGGASLAQGVRGLLCVLMFVSLFLSAGLYPLAHRLIRPLLFLGISAVLTSFAGPYPYEHIVLTMKLGLIALVFAGAFQLAKEGLASERWLTACAWAILLAMTINTGIGLAAGKRVGVYESQYATAGLVGEPTVASALIMSALPVFLKSIPGSGSAIVGVVVVFISLFFGMCRCALIAAIAGTCGSLAIGLSSLRGRIPWRRALMPVCILILLAAIGLSTSAGADLAGRFKELNPLEGTGSGRYIFWRISLEHLVNRPMHVQLQGEGVGSSRDLIKRQYGLWITPHNDWLDLVHSFGLLGLIGISWWCLELVRLAGRFRDHAGPVLHRQRGRL